MPNSNDEYYYTKEEVDAFLAEKINKDSLNPNEFEYQNDQVKLINGAVSFLKLNPTMISNSIPDDPEEASSSKIITEEGASKSLSKKIKKNELLTSTSTKFTLWVESIQNLI